MTERIITLPWPKKELSQNEKVHWRRLAKVTATYRYTAWVLANEAKVPKDPKAFLEFTFHPPNNRWDCQNIPGMMKSAIDGIADAMGVDDRHFRCRFPDGFAEVVSGGCVVVRITPKLSTDIPLVGEIG